jgi:hypothetical protein
LLLEPQVVEQLPHLVRRKLSEDARLHRPITTAGCHFSGPGEGGNGQSLATSSELKRKCSFSVRHSSKTSFLKSMRS